MTKARGIGRGGVRRGAGRPPGARNKRTVLTEILPQLAAQDRQLPLYRLLDRIADESLDARYRDVLCIQVLPFLHSRLRSDLTAKPPLDPPLASNPASCRARHRIGAQWHERSSTHRALLARERHPVTNKTYT
jgi:hypothetical protein